jgi:hypothetical protein
MAHYWPGSIQKQLILYDASIKPPNIEKVKEFCAFVEGILYGERSHQTAVASDIAPDTGGRRHVIAGHRCGAE